MPTHRNRRAQPGYWGLYLGGVAVGRLLLLPAAAAGKREVPMGADASQLFLFQYREKWAPSGPPPPGAAH